MFVSNRPTENNKTASKAAGEALTHGAGIDIVDTDVNIESAAGTSASAAAGNTETRYQCCKRSFLVLLQFQPFFG